MKIKSAKFSCEPQISGFTLLEVSIATVMTGILATLGSASFTGFMNQQKLDRVNEQIYLSLQEAKIKARQGNEAYQANFQVKNGKLQYLVRKGNATPDSNSSAWQNFEGQAGYKINLSPASTSIVFDYKGQPRKDDIGKKIAVTSSYTSKKRCVRINTLLGEISTLQDANCN